MILKHFEILVPFLKNPEEINLIKCTSAIRKCVQENSAVTPKITKGLHIKVTFGKTLQKLALKEHYKYIANLAITRLFGENPFTY